MFQNLRERLGSQKGQALAEYALVVAFVIAIVVVLMTSGYYDGVKLIFEKIVEGINIGLEKIDALLDLAGNPS